MVPVVAGVFGDWFGGPLAHLFGNGVRDVRVTGNRLPGRRPRDWLRFRLAPAYAHALYFSFPYDTSEASVTLALRQAMGLDSTGWLDR